MIYENYQQIQADVLRFLAGHSVYFWHGHQVAVWGLLFEIRWVPDRHLPYISWEAGTGLPVHSTSQKPRASSSLTDEKLGAVGSLCKHCSADPVATMSEKTTTRGFSHWCTQCSWQESWHRVFPCSGADFGAWGTCPIHCCCHLRCIDVLHHSLCKGYSPKINAVFWKLILGNWCIGLRSTCRKWEDHLPCYSAFLFGFFCLCFSLSAMASTSESGWRGGCYLCVQEQSP